MPIGPRYKTCGGTREGPPGLLSSPMEPSAALASASETFLAKLDGVGDDQLDLATPCEGWTVRDLLTHVARGSEMSVRLVEGCSTEEARAMFTAPEPADAVAACRATIAAQLAALTGDVDVSMTVHHPMGDVTAAQLIGFRTGDLALHAWDLARAIGGDERLPDDLVEEVYGELDALRPIIGAIGVFGEGPSGTVADDADLLTRTLDLSGRRP